MEILNLSFTKLLKLELPELAERVIGVFETYDPEEFKIQDAYDQLVAQQPQIDALLAQYGAHPLTVTLDRLRRKRARYAAKITSQLRYSLKEQSDNQDVINAMATTEQFLLYLRKNNEEVINRKITQFFAETQRNEQLATTLDTLNVIDYLDNLKASHASIQRLDAQRVLSISARPKGKTEELSKSVRKALDILFMQIEVAHVINKDLDYLPMISAVNEIIVRYKNLINTRAAYNKKKKEGLEDEPEMTPEGEGEKPEMMTTFVAPTNGIELPKLAEMNGNGSNGELAHPLEQKKTAVLSTKLVQLPLTNNEA